MGEADQIIPQMTVMAGNIVRINYSICNRATSETLRAVISFIRDADIDHQNVAFLSVMPLRPEFIIDPKVLRADQVPFVIRRSAWVVDPGSRYSYQRVLEGLEPDYEVKLFGTENQALEWLRAGRDI